MNKPKILLVSTRFPYPENFNGITKINYHLLQANSFYTMDVLCGRSNDLDLTIHSLPESNSVFLLDSEPVLSNFKHKLKWIFSKYPNSAIVNNNFVSELVLFLNENHTRYDVIHLSGAHFAPVLKRLDDCVKKKCALFAIDSLSLYWHRRFKNEKKFLYKILYRVEELKSIHFERKYYLDYSSVVFVSDVDTQHYKLVCKGHNGTTIVNGVDITYFISDRKEDSKEKSIVFTGNMDYAPNNDAAFFLIDSVMPIIHQKYPSCKLYLVGNRPNESLKAKSSEKIIITGFVDDIRYYLRNSTVYVSPLQFGSGMKNKILEALASGMCVIGNHISFDGILGHSEINSILVDDSTPEAFAFAIESVFEMQECDKNAIQLNARLLVEKSYSWDAIRELYSELYLNYII